MASSRGLRTLDVLSARHRRWSPSRPCRSAISTSPATRTSRPRARRAPRRSRRAQGRGGGGRGRAPRSARSRCSADVRSPPSRRSTAKVSGYLKTVAVDRGDRVEAGQIVAQIELPEIDQQYAAAVTDLEHKKRNLERSRGAAGEGQHHAGGDAAVRDRCPRGRSQRRRARDHEGLPDHPRAVRRPGDGALRRSRRADHQCADQPGELAAGDDDLGRQPAARLRLCAAAGRAVRAMWAMPPKWSTRATRNAHDGQGDAA